MTYSQGQQIPQIIPSSQVENTKGRNSKVANEIMEANISICNF